MHSPWVGVDLAADNVAWARLVRSAYDVMLSGRGTPPVLRDVVVRSWGRCIAAGVDPERPAPRLLDEGETRERFGSHPLAAVVPLIRELFADIAEDARHLAAISDADGLLLWSEGHPSMVEAAVKPHFLPGCLCGETGVGTNAIGTALALDHAIQIFSAEHFNRLLHGWTGSAAPVHDPGTNQLLGAIGLSGSFRRAHPHTLAVVSAAARLAETHLAERQADRDNALRTRYLDLVARSRPRRSALVARDGRVLAATPLGWLAGRLELPSSGGEVSLDGGPRLAIEPLGPEASVVWDAGAQRDPPHPRLDVRALGRDHVEVDLLGRTLELGPRQGELAAHQVLC
ncbi:MAG: transcriptional regulator, partial [Solirubrobacteraceae bacterium]